MSETALAPVNHEAVTRMVAGMAEIMGEELSPKRLVGYVELLIDIPLADLQAGMQRAMRSCKWFPKPAEIRRACDAVKSAAPVDSEVMDEVVVDQADRAAVSSPARRAPPCRIESPATRP